MNGLKNAIIMLFLFCHIMWLIFIMLIIIIIIIIIQVHLCISLILAAPDRFDSQGVAPIDLITSRKLNYCHLVFTSYQRYRERLASMQANLGGTVNEGNVEDQNSPNEAQNVETEKCNSFEYNGVEKVYEEDEEAKERR